MAGGKWVYTFGDGKAEGEAGMKNLLGGKGANLAEMSQLGLPVPPGFTITTEACVHYYANERSYPADLKDQVAAGLKKVEEITGKTFGDPANPLLVSVRSGARASMPGMMDTVLNLGLNDVSVGGLAKQHDGLGPWRAAGLFLGQDIIAGDALTPDAARTSRIVNGLRAARVLISATGPRSNVLKIRPPLVFSKANVDHFLQAFDQVLARG